MNDWPFVGDSWHKIAGSLSGTSAIQELCGAILFSDFEDFGRAMMHTSS